MALSSVLQNLHITPDAIRAMRDRHIWTAPLLMRHEHGDRGLYACPHGYWGTRLPACVPGTTASAYDIGHGAMIVVVTDAQGATHADVVFAEALRDAE